MKRNLKPLVLYSHLLVATLFSLIAIFAAGISNLNFGDAPDYLTAGLAIANGETYPRIGTLPFFRPPGYPLLIAMIAAFTTDNLIIALKILNVVFHTLTTLLIFKISSKFFSKNVALLAAILYAANPFSLYQTIGISTETLTAFLFTYFVFLLTINGSLTNTALLASVSILLSFTRPEYFFIVFPILIFGLIKNHLFMYSKPRFLLLLLLHPLVILVWGLSNLRATGKFIPFTDAANYHLWMGSLNLIRENYAIGTIGRLNFDELQLERLLNLIQAKIQVWGDAYTLGSIGDRSDLWMLAFSESISDQGLISYVGLLLFKGLVFWRPFLNPASYDLEIFLLSIPLLLFLSFSLFVGSVKFWNMTRFRLVLGSYWLGLAVLTGVHMLQLPDQRYRIPLLLPIGTILFAALFFERVKRLPKFPWRRMRDLNPR